MRHVIIAAALLLTACQTAPPATVVVGSVKPVEIRVPVVQPCLEPGSVEALPGSAMPPRTADVEALAAGAYADLLRYRELAERQRALLAACASVTPPKGQP